MASPSHKKDQEEEEHQRLVAKLPDHLFERILSLLPILDVLRARIVCRRWRQVLCSAQFLRLCSRTHPWYFMFSGEGNSSGILYDPSTRKWHCLMLPRMVDSRNWMVSATSGLVVFMNTMNYEELYICNPVTQSWCQLPRPAAAPDNCYYVTMALSVDPETGAQITIVARWIQVPNDFWHWPLLLDVYHSAHGWHRRWYTRLQCSYGGESSVICNGVFYCVTNYTLKKMLHTDRDGSWHGLVAYNITEATFSLVDAEMPCCFTFVKLINCNGELVMVGGIARTGMMKGIGIWELCSQEWREISRMPRKDFRTFAKRDYVLSTGGMGDLIYIHSYNSPSLMLYHMTERTWRWSQRSQLREKYDGHFFSGFCFEPQVGAAISSS